MKIFSINNNYNNFILNTGKKNSSKKFTNPLDNFLPKSDTVSFSAKKYDIEDILNPTNHCAYCGCKVYSQAQIDSIAREILQSKAGRLEGKVKSILEKLDGAKNAQDIALAKRLENEEQIKFFKNFLEIAEKKSFLKGETIFEQVYGLDKDTAFESLVNNMHPLLRTIEHVSPQNEDKENNNSDVNLVEACYCCNHDLKKGMSFNEFYAIYPSIKNNMPSDKFNYAISSILDSSQSSVMQRISAQSLLKLIDSLFNQRNEASSYLESIDLRIKGCKSSIGDSIKTCQTEIDEKNNEIEGLKARLDTLMQDPEFVAMLDRMALCEKLDNHKTLLDSLRVRRQRNSDAINDLRNPKQNKKGQTKYTPEETEQKIESLKNAISELSAKIAQQEEACTAVELEILELDEKFPTIEILQRNKAKAESIYKAHVALAAEKNALEQKYAHKKELEDNQSQLKAQIENLPDNSSSFDINQYSEENQRLYSRYCDLVDSLKYIEEHSNGSGIKSLINQSAKEPIIQEINSLKQKDVIVHYLNYSHRKELEQQLSKLQKALDDTKNSIEESKKNCENLERASSEMSMQEACNQIESLSEIIKRLTEKQNLIKIPQRINILQTEIALLENTIENLRQKTNKIDSSFNVTV